MRSYHDVIGWKVVIHHAITCQCTACQRFDEDCRAAGVMTVKESVLDRVRRNPFGLTSVPADRLSVAAAVESG